MSAYLRAFNYANGQLTVQDSSDAINWAAEPIITTLPGLATPYAAFFSYIWVVIGADAEGTVWSWTDDINLDGSAKNRVGCSGIPLGLVCSDSVFVLAVPNDQNSHSTYFYTSNQNDGTTWVQSSSIPATITGFAINIDDNTVVAVANDGTVYVSTDSAVTWNVTASLPKGQWSVSYNTSETFVAWSGQSIYHSTDDGTTWAASTIAGVQGVNITDLQSDTNTTYVAIGWKSNPGDVVAGNTIPPLAYYYGSSTDGITFTFQVFPVQPNSADKIFRGCATPWTVVGQGSVLYSSDLSTWTLVLNTAYQPCVMTAGLLYWWC